MALGKALEWLEKYALTVALCVGVAAVALVTVAVVKYHYTSLDMLSLLALTWITVGAAVFSNVRWLVSTRMFRPTGAGRLFKYAASALIFAFAGFVLLFAGYIFELLPLAEAAPEVASIPLIIFSIGFLADAYKHGYLHTSKAVTSPSWAGAAKVFTVNFLIIFLIVLMGSLIAESIAYPLPAGRTVISIVNSLSATVIEVAASAALAGVFTAVGLLKKHQG